MKKIAILTITNSGLNFGNRLQNFALQESLRDCGAEVETIQSAKSVKGSIILSSIRRTIKMIVKNDKRRKCFNHFNKKYVTFSKKIRYENINESDFANKYDAFVAGSDQVWNPNFHFNSDFEFASFAPENKRYSYAASIGVSDIKGEHKEAFIKNIQGMKELSVREEDSIPLIRRLTGRDALIHVDPTMLLEKEKYFEIEEIPPQGLPEKYLLTYFLGNVPDEYQRNIQKLADRLSLEVVNLSETKGTKYYEIGPQHFLYVLHHADYICTDSFHGSVFSILFEKRFSIFVRTDNDVPMNSRVETLVHKFGLQERLTENMNVEDALVAINYERVNEILAKERVEAKEYIKRISQN